MGAAAALVLAVVFAWSGVVKIFMGSRWPESLRRLELPVQLAWPVVGCELVLSMALVLLDVQRRWVASGAAVLLVAMTLVLVDRLRRGVRPACACFGGSSVRPLSWREPVRNFALLAVAFVAILS